MTGKSPPTRFHQEECGGIPYNGPIMEPVRNSSKSCPSCLMV
jgi:hypothetical protein